MIVAISQPEHMPYLGFFEKMARAQLFILLDHVRCQGPGSFQARNWFWDGAGEQVWFGVPLVAATARGPLHQVQVAHDARWRRKLRRKLALRFPDQDLDALYQEDLLVQLNLRGIDYIRQRLGVTTPLVRSSSLGVQGAKSELLARCCREVGASVYLSGPGGRAYLDPRAFGDLEVRFMTPTPPDHQSALAHLRQRLAWSSACS